jgi:hypothetical protein
MDSDPPVSLRPLPTCSGAEVECRGEHDLPRRRRGCRRSGYRASRHPGLRRTTGSVDQCWKCSSASLPSSCWWVLGCRLCARCVDGRSGHESRVPWLTSDSPSAPAQPHCLWRASRRSSWRGHRRLFLHSLPSVLPSGLSRAIGVEDELKELQIDPPMELTSDLGHVPDLLEAELLVESQ